MKWYSTKEFLPAKGTGYVIARVLNTDYCQFIYQAIHIGNEWHFWDEEYWPDERKNENYFNVTHWAHMPHMEDGGF